MKDLKSYKKPKEIPYDKNALNGAYYIVPIAISGIDGWNYSVRDIYKLKWKTSNEITIRPERTWVFQKREREFSKVEYFDEKKGKYVVCDCDPCVRGRKEFPDMDKKPEILTAKDFDL